MKRVFMRFDALTPQAIGGISKRTLIKLEQGQDVRFSTLTTVLSWLGLSLDFSAASKKVLEAAEHDKLKDGRREEAADDAQWF